MFAISLEKVARKRSNFHVRSMMSGTCSGASAGD
jgi:hypothetical protein